MKQLIFLLALIATTACGFAQSPKISQIPKYNPNDAQVDSMDVLGNVDNITRTVKGYKFKKAGRDSLAYFTLTQLDDTTILICNLKDECDTIIMVGDAVALTADRGVQRVGDNFRLTDTLEGAGDKFQWILDKHAFRTGSANGTQNNVANVGDYSTAMGQNNVASGYGSVCLGLNNTANTTLSVCIGQNNLNEAGNGIAVGGSNYVTGSASVAMGSNNRATGNNSVSLGVSTNADAYGSTATGFNNRAKSFGSFIGGYYNDSTQRGNANLITTNGVIFAIGNGANASNRHSFLEGTGQGWLKVDNTTDNNPPASVLDVKSTTSGMLPPRMTKTQRDAIVSPPNGSTIYQTDNTPGIRVWNGTNWMKYTETAD